MKTIGKRFSQIQRSLLGLWLVSALLAMVAKEAWVQEVNDFLLLICLALLICVSLPLALYRFNQRQAKRIVG